MADKRVSVRPVAERGRQVRAKPEGISEVGSRVFGLLSSKMELPNAFLCGVAREAVIRPKVIRQAAVNPLLNRSAYFWFVGRRP